MLLKIKIMNTKIKTIVAIALVLACVSDRASAQGLPAEARENIHTLFDQHTKVTRKVTMTKDGYEAVTESKDPKLAKGLREHVGQMSKRFESGRMVRGWDPAFRELRDHYDDISHQIEATEHGLKIVVKGATPEAIQVAQNHAGIVSRFAAHGWDEHDVRHPRAVGDDSEVTARAEPAGIACSAKACCLVRDGNTQSANKKSCCGKADCQECENPNTKTK